MNIFGNHNSKRASVVVGAYAGGVEVLRELVAQFPADFPASVFIVLHIPAEYPSKLPEILAYRCRLPVAHPTDEQKYEKGHINVAPPDFHLLIDGDRIRLSRGLRENHSRPAIDVLFRSAARSGGSRVTRVILTGVLDDGTAGLFAVKAAAGNRAGTVGCPAPRYAAKRDESHRSGSLRSGQRDGRFIKKYG